MTQTTITTSTQAETMRARLAEHTEALTALSARQEAIEAEIGRVLLAETMSGKDNSAALASLEQERTGIDRQVAHTRVVIDGLRNAIAEWDGGQGARQYQALIPKLEEAHAAGAKLEAEYLALAEQLIAAGSALSRARLDQRRILDQMAIHERANPPVLTREAVYRGEEKRQIRPPFPIDARWMDHHADGVLHGWMVERANPHWRGYVSDPQPTPDADAGDDTEPTAA